MNGPSEDRQNVRIIKTGAVRMVWRRAFFRRKMDGNIVDVSARGLQVSAPSPLPEGRKVKLDVRLFSGPQERQRYRLYGRVIRFAPDSISGRWLIGIALTSVRGDRRAWNSAIFAFLRSRNEF
ncbi:MAG TPA: PilZ domain-containing protein [Kiritimatiellia bacterium]|nr:PilZ domain-containing protein [Kiritimatiellia bacterium]HNR93538.1 PilZ domain-containing protein [Kiritimatiellia bacterium]HNS81542.1 PilZ domain-containing protein [Kiritimatiellia bacterium]HPA78341.1 PilZ domain-containing protein [Kiritimatiellia bacterium]HQQ04429.1 PilZ domain-containing protein [Kiritimatiellia bacterium]